MATVTKTTTSLDRRANFVDDLIDHSARAANKEGETQMTIGRLIAFAHSEHQMAHR